MSSPPLHEPQTAQDEANQPRVVPLAGMGPLKVHHLRVVPEAELLDAVRAAPIVLLPVAHGEHLK